MRITICDDDKLITFQLTEYLNEFFQNSLDLKCRR